ncbi:LOW QUALITY PROTEIN: zinc finger protein 252 [Drosophila busckii]|uniref:LOW QUALITY PROTEIN: zinc finger protein 252 n=1 Tax=Drosophila busckii TaxID=30019 RepID=UPI001432FC90|nr:LOW QUALITY PROTEIN: zinc finger protein 252 [Drosophila busckii]
MPSFCAVVNCSYKYVRSDSLSFHRFPFRRKDLLQQWQDFTLRGNDWIPSKWSSVCSRHFLDSDFSKIKGRKTLKKNAVPTVRVADESLNVIVEQVTLSTDPLVSSNSNNATNVGTKSTCRFCGNTALNCVSFDKSLELYGMIQKCFPTLQILNDDTLPLPKDICDECCKQLEHFSQFCDVVMLAQTELQRKYRRQLMIKQEPVVRVKQEACETLDNLFPDELDMGLDDACCDHEPGGDDENEQKFQFCNFPMLNAQDIINNCDIMEIINLDDPFINIADDADVTQAQPVNSTLPVVPTVNEMIQSEMLIEEHNYAKEDWQSPSLRQYKKEKVEPELPVAAAAAEPEARSTKPIVTNVSQIPNPMLCELLPPPPPAAPATTTVSKPNIVVLNDSVVQSSAFRLHNCNLCSTKFFTSESLNQHYAQAHGTPTSAPMVSVPPLNLNMTVAESKLESSATLTLPTALTTTDYWQAEWLPAQQQQQLPAKKKIDILDMQRSFLHHDLISSSAALPAPLLADTAPKTQNSAYAKLAARYRRLQSKMRDMKAGSSSSSKSTLRRHRCSQCARRFVSLMQLLTHRRRRRHFVLPPTRIFAVKCFGCTKLFHSRLSLRQHMRYICQSLPLRTARLQRYKCRHCQSISFTHWRIYRRHELKCRQQRQSKGKGRCKQNQMQAKRCQTSHSCNACQKVFSSLNGLRQHRITHTLERRYNCNICERVYKRRNGLSQHVKGYHLQLKPHQCPVCQHHYALKGDMLRCRHSLRLIPQSQPK